MGPQNGAIDVKLMLHHIYDSSQSHRNRIAGCGRNRPVGHAPDALRLSASGGGRDLLQRRGTVPLQRMGVSETGEHPSKFIQRAILIGKIMIVHRKWEYTWIHYFQSNPSRQTASTCVCTGRTRQSCLTAAAFVGGWNCKRTLRTQCTHPVRIVFCCRLAVLL